ncbi:MAG: PAS domain S-box protein [Leptospiraceae bacterium]|nr:PAS domain S-box protein [Leptospiraceae bacterium]
MGVEQSPVSIVITNTKGEIEYVNPWFSEVTGYSRDEVIGQNPRILKSGFTSPNEYLTIWDQITRGEKWKGTFHNKKKNGRIILESANISPIQNAKGEITHFIGIKENITAQINADKKIKESEEKYRLILQTSRDLIHILDINGNLIEFNSAF